MVLRSVHPLSRNLLTCHAQVHFSLQRREAGVGFTIKKDIVTKLTEMPRPVSDSIMTMRLPVSKDNFATIISVNAPTVTNPDEKEAFYN